MPAPRQVRLAFGRHADTYDDLTIVQKRVREKIYALCRHRVASPRVVVDIGAGTGKLLKELERVYPDALMIPIDAAHGMSLHAQRVTGLSHAVTADAEAIPLRSGRAGLVISSSAFQWLDLLDTPFREIHRILLPGGWFIFSLFGSRTLWELRDSYRRAAQRRNRTDRTRTFPSREDVSASLLSAGFRVDSLWTECEEEIYSDVPSLIRAIRGIGANTPRTRAISLAERGVMVDMMDIYRVMYGKNSMIPASYEVVYGIARAMATDTD
ncbi:MAG: malonyl-ACP O-methyltransferase BioC [Desulfuromonadia bacterium]